MLQRASRSFGRTCTAQLRPVIALLAVTSLLVACGEDSDLPTEATTPTSVGEADLRDDPFNSKWVAICEDFYVDVGPKQQELSELRVSSKSSSEERQKGIEVVEEIQDLSDQFVERIKAAPLPRDPDARGDAEEVIDSLDTFRTIQDEYFDGIIEAVRTGDESLIRKPELVDAQTALNDELTKQKALLVRLGLPECASPT